MFLTVLHKMSLGKAQEDWEGLGLNETHQLIVYAGAL
jgi:hypothetical protein